MPIDINQRRSIGLTNRCERATGDCEREATTVFGAIPRRNERIRRRGNVIPITSPGSTSPRAESRPTGLNALGRADRAPGAAW